MALVISDRVKETSTTTGTGTLTLAGAVTGFETFTANLSDGDTTYYCCTDNTDFEVGLGTFTASGTTLARTTILASSNSGSAVNWGAGTRTVFCTLPAAKTVFLDGSNVTNISNLKLASGATVTAILDEDTLSSDSATALATQQSIKAYVDTQLTAEDLDFQADTGGALSIDLDSESLTFTGGTGIDTSGSGNAVTFAIDSTVATLTGSQTLTNKSIDASQLTGTVADARLSSSVKIAGTETIWVPANSMYPNTTNGCESITQIELSNGPEIKVLDFDPSSDENAQFSVAFPKSWNEGTITFKAFFTVTGTDTGTVAWGLSGVAIADDDSIDTAFGTNVVATAKAHSGTSNDLDVTAESGAVTIAGSPAAGEQVFFQIMRDVSADTQTGDARLLGIQLFFTTDAANDE